MKKFVVTLVLYLAFYSLNGQVIINAYAKVTAVSGSSILAVSNVNETNHTFNVSEHVIVMQMQDNVIGTNTTNAASFGDLSAIANAGNYEIRTISSRSPASGTPTTITLSAGLGNTYNTGTNSSVQLITMHYLGTNFTTTNNITGLAWSGTNGTGGVIGMEIGSTLTLNHSIIADGLGFAGGAISAAADEPCDNTFYTGNDANKGYKGEGIYKVTSSTYNNGRAKILTGGGGGSQNNAGGGGGGNYSSGGNSGLGWQCNTSNSGYALGAISLSASISASRIFMGGGGGGGQQNNNVGTAGANGGGIILIKATTIATNTICSSPIVITANGINGVNSGNDGAGGGGAGGSILLQVNTFSITSACSLTNSASGGNGGNVTDSGAHGGGGGGGQGVVIYAIPQPTTNIRTQVNNGTAGTDNSGGTTTATTGSTSSGTGVVVASSASPLPIVLVNFYAESQANQVKLMWITATEKNNSYFIVEKSENGIDFTLLGSVKGAGNSESRNSYQLYDNNPYSGVSYYRLKQTDLSGAFKYFPIIDVNHTGSLKFSVFPNPAEQGGPVSFAVDKNFNGSSINVSVSDLTGKEVFNTVLKTSDQTGNRFTITNLDVEKGIYLLKLENGYSSDVHKLIVK